MSINDNADKIILDPVLSDSVCMSIQEAVNKGKNVKIRVRSKNLQQQKREALVSLQHLDLFPPLILASREAINNIPKTIVEVSRRVTNIGEFQNRNFDL